jgi:RecA/RadA recombinase
MAQKLDKNVLEALAEIDKINPYAAFLNENTISNVTEWIDTGSMPLNAIISGSLYGGIPRNRVTMVAGESMTGKTFFLLQTLAQAQKQGLVPVIFDPEFAIDTQSATNLGLDPAGVKYVPCYSIEEARNAVFKFLTKAKELGIENKFIVAIEIGNLENQLQINRMEAPLKSGESNMSMDMGTRARAMGSLMRTCTILAGFTKTTFLITNHIYDDPSATYESIIKVMPGGKKVAYLPSVTVQLSRKPEKGDEGKTMDAALVVAQRNYPGTILRALTIKNRFIQQYLQIEMYLSFTTGLDKYYGLLDLAVGFGVVINDGATYSLPDGTKLGYYKKWRKDEAIWKQILPALEEKIKGAWAYGAGNQSLVEEEVPDESEEKA